MTQFLKSELCDNCAECNRRVPLFNILSREELTILNEGRTEVRFRAGEIIIKQGMPSNHLISVTSGLAKLYVEGIDEKNLLIEIARPWTFFGGPGIYLDGRYHYSAAAVEETTTCFIKAENIKRLVRANPDFAEAFIHHCSTKSARIFERMVSLTQKQMHGRIADALIYLMDDVFDGNTSFELSISRQELADLTAMTKDSAVRILKDLQTDQIIDQTNGTMHILNKEKLIEISLRG